MLRVGELCCVVPVPHAVSFLIGKRVRVSVTSRKRKLNPFSYLACFANEIPGYRLRPDMPVVLFVLPFCALLNFSYFDIDFLSMVISYRMASSSLSPDISSRFAFSVWNVDHSWICFTEHVKN